MFYIYFFLGGGGGVGMGMGRVRVRVGRSLMSHFLELVYIQPLFVYKKKKIKETLGIY